MDSPQDTSSYWRRLLKLDEEVPADFAAKLDSFWKIFRRPLHNIISKLAKSDFDLSARGLENLPEKPPFLIASNHSSSLDFPAVFLSLPEKYKKDVVAMYTSFFDRIPPAKAAIKTFVPSFAVDLEGSFWDALSKAGKVLKSGKIVYIAPEGQRSYDGKLLPFKVGVGALAVETKTPVVPAYIKGTFEALPRGRFIPRKHPVKVIFGKPLETEEFFIKKGSLPAYDVYKEFTEKLRREILRLGSV